MARQLNIRSDEGYDIAHRLAQRLGKTTTDVVVSALREYQAQRRIASASVTAAEAEANYRALMKAVSAAHAKAPAKILTSEEMYDESGLPK
jgi:hypothetical protein